MKGGLFSLVNLPPVFQSSPSCRCHYFRVVPRISFPSRPVLFFIRAFRFQCPVPLRPRSILWKVPGAQRSPISSASSSRSLVENAVQSCLLIPNLATKDAVEARLLRARTRFAAGYTLGAHKGLRSLTCPSEWFITCHSHFAPFGEPRRY